MKRREFITLLGGATAAWPLAGRAQQPGAMRRVGILMSAAESDKDAQLGIAVFRETLDRRGWNEGRNLRIESRWGEANPARITALAKELVELSPDILVAYTTPSVKALQQETRSIPIVFLSVTDPLGQGIVASLAHPGGNTTGFAVFEFSLGAKFLEILKQISPNVARVTTIFNPETAPYYPLYLRSIEQGASSFAVELIAVEIHNDADIERTLGALARDPDAGLIVLPDSFNIVHRARIIELAHRHRLPAIYFFQYFARDGGLVTYGPDENELFQRTASYVDRIFKGDRPSDLPVQHPTKFTMVINLRTAKALGFIIPPLLLASADEVIE